MGADVWFVMKIRKEEVPEEFRKMIEEDGSIVKENPEAVVMYWRDSYNPLNVAWIASLCYWRDFPEDVNVRSVIGFFERIAQLNDERIETYAEKLIERGEEVETEELLEAFRWKRDYARWIIRKADRIEKVYAWV